MSSVFDKHRQIMDEYKSYVSSFFRIEDERIKDTVEASVLGGQYWPEPLIQFNPSFEPGESIQELVKQGVLEARCDRVLCRDQRCTPKAGCGDDELFATHLSFQFARLPGSSHLYRIQTFGHFNSPKDLPKWA